MDSVKKNYTYNFVYQIFTILMPFITAPYVSRVLGASGIGTHSFYFSIATYFVYFEMLGVNNYGVRSIAKCKSQIERNQVFSDIYCVQLIMSIISILMYGFFAAFISMNIPISLALIPYVLSGAMDINWYFFGTEQFAKTTTRNAIAKLLTIVLIFIFVRKTSDLKVYSLIMAMGYFVSQVVMWGYAVGELKFCKPNKHSIRTNFKSLIVLFIPVIAVSLYKTMDKIMLGSLATMEQVGLYENAEKISSAPSIITVALGATFLPRMTSLLSNGDDDTFNGYLRKSIYFSFFMSFGLCAGIIAVSDVFIPLYYGISFGGSVNVLIVLSFSLIFSSGASVLRTQYLIPMNKDKIYVISVLIGAIANIVVNIILIPIMGAVGAGVGTVVAEGAVAACQMICVSKETSILKYIRNAILFSIPSAIMCFFLKAIKMFLNCPLIIQLIILISIGISFYFVLSIPLLRLVNLFNISLKGRRMKNHDKLSH